MSSCHPTGKLWPGINHLIKAKVSGLVDGLDPLAKWQDLPICMIDTETTGFSPVTDRVIELGLVIARQGTIQSRHRWLINPGMPIPEASTQVHGITDEKVAKEPRFEELAPAIKAYMHGCIPAAFNADFDRRFVFAEFARTGADSGIGDAVVWLDPLIWSRELYSKQRSRKLRGMALTLGVLGGTDHSAESDAVLTVGIMHALANEKDLLTQKPKVPTEYSSLVKWQQQLRLSQADNQRFWQR